MEELVYALYKQTFIKGKTLKWQARKIMIIL